MKQSTSKHPLDENDDHKVMITSEIIPPPRKRGRPSLKSKANNMDKPSVKEGSEKSTVDDLAPLEDADTVVAR